MTSYLLVIPSIYEPYTKACLESLELPEDNIVVVDNTVRNRGVAASWNIGVDQVLAEERDWLIVCSAAMRFEAGGWDLIDRLVQADEGVWAVEAAWGIGWHLIAFPHRTFQLAGRFDENFYPAHYEDNDFSWRIRLAAERAGDKEQLWPKVDVAAYVHSFAHGVRYGNIVYQPEVLRAYFKRKWGAMPSKERYLHPFRDESKSVGWWPEVGHPFAVDRPVFSE